MASFTAIHNAGALSGERMQNLPERRGSRSHSGTKRAYRQRRKEPSCDACRDRKVKCNATDTSSCSECIGRGVACQFTKDTNKRMSSMKQIQDLQNQLAAAKRELNDMMTSKDSPGMPSASDESDAHRLMHGVDLTQVRYNMQHYGRDWLVASTTGQIMQSPQKPPDHKTAWSAAMRYLDRTNRWLPLLDGPAFHRTVTTMYAQVTAINAACVGILLAIMAYDTACVRQPRPYHYHDNILQQAEDSFEFYAIRDPVDACRIAAIISLVYLERTQLGQSSRWLAKAIRLAQETGLHLGKAKDPDVSRVWPCLVFLDRLISFEHSLPLLVDTSDCEPRALTFETVDNVDRVYCTQMMAVARQIERAIKAMRTNTIDSTTLQQLDHEMEAIAQVCNPPAAGNEPKARAWSYLWTVIQSCRLLLHRHNLHIASSKSQRQDALESCAGVAEETVAHGTLREPPSTYFECHHMWRSVLILLMAGEISAARSLWHVVSHAGFPLGLGSTYLWFFTTRLLLKMRSRIDPLEDGEMLAYVTLDRQNQRTGWMWQEDANVPDVPATLDKEVRWEDIADVLHQLQEADAQEAQLTLTTQLSPQMQHTTISRSSQLTPTTIINRISIADLV